MTYLNKQRGAEWYLELFPESEKFGSLYVEVLKKSNFQGIQLWVVPEGLNCEGINLLNTAADVLLVFKMIKGEEISNGWIERGKWEADFGKICEERNAKIEQSKKEEQEKDRLEISRKSQERARKIQRIRENYQSPKH